jgi:general stress protein 26
MSMKTVKEIMKQAGWSALASTDGKRVGVRPMAGWAWVGSEFWCASAKSSDKVRQISKVPHVEYLFVDKRGRHVRLAGRCTVSTRLADKKKLFDLGCSGLKQHVVSPENPGWVVLRLKPNRVRLMATTDFKYQDVRLK